MRFYLDADIASGVANALLTLKHEVKQARRFPTPLIHTPTDLALSAYKERSILLTHDRRLIELWHRGVPRTSVILYTKDRIFSEYHRVRLYTAIGDYEVELLAGAMLQVTLLRTKIEPRQRSQIAISTEKLLGNPQSTLVAASRSRASQLTVKGVQ